MKVLNTPSPQSRASLWLIGTFIFFGIMYALISLVNHYNFRTYALDLGMVNHAVYDYAHFRKNVTTLLLDSPPTNFLANHFTLIPLLVSPLYWLFGNYTMLIVQLAAILFGGFGVYKFARYYGASEFLQIAITLFFFLQWSIFSALSYDYHDNVIGAMFLPWFLLYFERKRFGIALFFFLLIVTSKENMALWAFFIAAGVGVRHFRNRKMLLLSLGLMVFSILYFGVITKVVMQGLDTMQRDFAQLNRYRHLGQTPADIILNLLTDPTLVLRQLFLNTTTDPNYDYIKIELYGMMLLSGGLALFFRPWYLVMAIPIIAQKILSADYSLWGINGQYTIELAPILTLAFLEALLLIKSEKKRRQLAMLSAVIIFSATLFTLHHRQSKWFDKAAAQFFRGKHYRSFYNTDKMYTALERIPDGVAVSAQSWLTPHLEKREKLYHFPIVSDAEFVLASKKLESIYPLTKERQLIVIDSIRQSASFKVDYEDEQLVIFKRQAKP